MSAAYDMVDHRTRSCITVRPRADRGASALLQDRGEVGTAHECTSPAGESPIDGPPKCPVVVPSRSVGLTSKISIGVLIAEAHPDEGVWYAQATTDPAAPAVDVDLRVSTGRHGPVEVTTFDERLGDRDDAHESRVTIWWLRPDTAIANANFLVRDPHPFPPALTPGLKAADVPEALMHFEPVGPAVGPVAA